MAHKDKPTASQLLVPGDVVMLLTPLQELNAGMYLLYSIADDWVVLRWLIDNETEERIIVTERESTLPASLLKLFMPIGLRLTIDGPQAHVH